MKLVDDYYNFANIRTLLTKSFSIDELLTFCFDEAPFRAVYDDWSGRNTKNDLVRSIIDHAYRRLKVEVVLDWVKQANPTRFEQHQPYFNAKYLEETREYYSIVSVLSDNSIGKGISIGGKYLGVSLRIVATEWTDYGTNRQIRSGWLFIPQWTANHAITFFKIHIYDNGTGYVHIVDTTDPAHPVYLTTSTGLRFEKSFHYLSHPGDTWQFTWRE